ncbi:hypothetical protein HC928_04005 [bacterium]|nr:hypothetical protein [bacterium]
MGRTQKLVIMVAAYGIVGILLLQAGIAPVIAQTQRRSITVGETVVNELRRAGERHAYTFVGTAGQGTSISLWAGGNFSLDTFLTLHDPTDKIIAEDNDSGEGSNSYIETILPLDGVYTIVVSGYVGTVGWYGLQLNLTGDATGITPPVDLPQGEPISSGVGVIGVIDAPTVENYYAFNAVAGQGVQIAMWSGGTQTLDPLVVLLDPQGLVFAEDDNGARQGTSSFMRVVTPISGTYTIIARGAHDSVGAYGLQMDFFTAEPDQLPPASDEPEQPSSPAPDEPTPRPNLPPAPPIPSNSVQDLAPGVAVNGRIVNAGDMDFYSFNGGQGQRISMSMWNGSNSDIDSYLMLIGPDKQAVDVDDNGAGNGRNAYREVELPTTGTYVIVASGANGTTGAYGLVFDFLR